MKKDIKDPIDTLRNLAENKKCFDCHEKGTTYAVMDFGVFTCSTCAGVHREFGHKVKGLGMCIFNEEEVKNLTQNGNKNQQANLMANWNAKSHPEPDKKNNTQMKDFFTMKYTKKRFMAKSKKQSSKKKVQDSSDSDSDVSSSDSEEKRKKKKKKAKDSKKDKKKKHVESSDEEAEEQKNDEDFDSDASDFKKKKESKVGRKFRKGGTSGLAPP